MKILVIGNGFLACPIIEKLDSEGHEVNVYSRKVKSNILVQQIEGDILKSEKLQEVFRNNYQVVINTAWITTQSQYPTHESNKDYSRCAINLASRAAQSGVEHFVGFGSCAEYGKQSSPCIAGETILNPENLYAEQKIETFRQTRQLIFSTKTKFSWLRVFQPYGLRQDPGRLIPYLINGLKNQLNIEIRDDKSYLDWVTTRDIASAVSWVLSNSLPSELDIATSIGHSNLEILDYLQVLLGKAKQVTLLDKSLVENTNCLVAGKESPIFTSGWRPKDTIETGLEWVVSNA
jgi:nucleoside-diphosphate-sugar epimerase